MTTKQNDELIEGLTPYFQRRNEPNFAAGNSISLFSNMPGLRLFCPMSSSDENGDAYDLSEQDRTLTIAAGNPKYGAGTGSVEPWIRLDGVGDYLSRADEAGLRITGTEADIAATNNGMFCGAWVRFENNIGAQEVIQAKWVTGTNDRSWLLERTAAGAADFSISSTGLAVTSTVSLAGALITPGTYKFVWGMFDPSANVYVGVNDQYNVAASADASIFSGAAQFTVGARGAGLGLATGRFSHVFLSAMYLPIVYPLMYYYQTKAMFGV